MVTMTDYRPATADDGPAMRRALSLAFGGSEDGVGTWLDGIGLDIVRVLEVDGEIAGTAILAPMGQYFGGASVPMTGIAGVTITPPMRGRGLGATLMRHCFDEIRGAGVPLSTLYASTQSLYRRVGYEQAGHLFRARLPLKSIPVARGAAVRDATESDRDAIANCYRRAVAHQDGHLDRGAYVWDRVYAPKGQASRGYVVDGPVGVDAYVFFQQKDELPNGRYNLWISDMNAATPEGAQALLAFLAGFTSMAEEAVFNAGPAHPLLMLLPEQHYSISRREYWMLRMVDAAGALTARGYAPGLRAEAHLDITDDTCGHNQGPLVLRVDDTKAHVEAGGQRRIRLDIRALTAVYTGFMDPRTLANLGLIEGAAEDLATLAAIFAGGGPSMADMF